MARSSMSMATAVCWSLLASVGFGLATYIVGKIGRIAALEYLGPLHQVPSSLNQAGLVWSANLYVSLPVMGRKLWKGSKWFVIEPKTNRKRYTAILSGMAAGLLNGSALFFSLHAFNCDPHSTGPLAALMTGDVALYAAFCHFVYKERLCPKQWIAILLLLVGLCCIALADDSGSSDNESAGFEVTTGLRLLAILFAFGSLLSYLGINLAIRIGDELGLGNSAAFVLRTFSIGIVGFPIVIYYIISRHRSLFSNASKYRGLPLLCGLSEVVASFATGKALEHPNSSVMVSIIGLNPVVVLVLSAAIDGEVPQPLALVGMAFALSSGYAIAAFAKSPEEGGDKSDEFWELEFGARASERRDMNRSGVYSSFARLANSGMAAVGDETEDDVSDDDGSFSSSQDMTPLRDLDSAKLAS